MINIIIPTYKRPDRIAPLLANIKETTVNRHRVTFVIEREDEASMTACKAVGAKWLVNQGRPSYAGAMNTGYRFSRPEVDYIFTGADDLVFHQNWDSIALFNMVDGIQVVGTQDGLNPYVQAGTHATHYLVDKRYLNEVGGVIDAGPFTFQNEVYHHNYVDTEFIDTARFRGVFAPCLDSHVEHLHWSVGKSVHDATYEKAEIHYGVDADTYVSRAHLWGGEVHN